MIFCDSFLFLVSIQFYRKLFCNMCSAVLCLSSSSATEVKHARQFGTKTAAGCCRQPAFGAKEEPVRMRIERQRQALSSILNSEDFWPPACRRHFGFFVKRLPMPECGAYFHMAVGHRPPIS